MAICITFGTHEFTSMLEGYENVRAYCYNCQHWNGHCITRWPWFTICFIPCIPLSTHKYKEVTCYTCRFTQDLRDRPDITPATRPPQGIPPGPAPPPQAYYAAGAAGGGYPPQGYPPPEQWQGQPQAPPPQNYNYK
ncbi:hypothetical protein KXX39_008632 [Aspergillus fumigatus]|nr:hypothetical protein KXX39_008632 [Aspergillus fumigatus]